MKGSPAPEALCITSPSSASLHKHHVRVMIQPNKMEGTSFKDKPLFVLLATRCEIILLCAPLSLWSDSDKSDQQQDNCGRVVKHSGVVEMHCPTRDSPSASSNSLRAPAVLWAAHSTRVRGKAEQPKVREVPKTDKMSEPASAEKRLTLGQVPAH